MSEKQGLDLHENREKYYIKINKNIQTNIDENLNCVQIPGNRCSVDTLANRNKIILFSVCSTTVVANVI